MQKKVEREKRGRIPPFGFMEGLMAGIGAASAIMNPGFPSGRYTGSGLSGDWRAVGGDMRTAIRKYDERKAS